MKIVLALFLSLLLTTSYAVTLKAKARAVLKALSDNSESLPSYRSVFKSLLKMTDVDEYDQVNEILVEVQQEIQGLLNDAQQKLDAETESYNNQFDQLNSQVTSLSGQLVETEANLESDTGKRDNLQGQISDNQQAIANNKDAADRESARRQNSQQAFADKIDALKQAIAQCDLAISVLDDVNEEDLPAGGSFLEFKAKRIQKNLQTIDAKLKEIKTTSPAVSFVQSLIKISQNGINLDDIESVLSLIEDIESSLKAQLSETQQEDEADDQTNQNILANLAATIQSEEGFVDDNQLVVNQLLNSIDNLTQTIVTLDGNVSDLNALLNDIGALHNVAVASYDDLISRLERDLEAIGQALSFIQSQQS